MKMVKIGSFWGQNGASGPKFRESGQKIFLKMFLKIISVRFMDINLVFNGVNLVKIGLFCENGQNWVILDHDFGDKNVPIIPEKMVLVDFKRLEYTFKCISYVVR